MPPPSPLQSGLLVSGAADPILSGVELVGGESRERRGRDGERSRNCRTHPVPADELAGAVSRRVRSRRHWQVFEVAPEIGRKMLGGDVAPFGLLVHGAEHDHIQVPARRRARAGLFRTA